ncbi:MAG: WbqC family protein [Candidatus Aminicenantes bacterium]|nr:WbqC family protein [Candidatus Aminicenantes bacterium]
MGKKVAIFQSNYIPWKGYFDIINMVDEFVFYDDVQYTKRDWRNRNLIKTAAGPHWLTIPVLVKKKFAQTVMEVKVNGMDWKRKHLKTILLNYRKAPCFAELKDFIEDLYESINFSYLCEINYFLIKKICAFLGIDAVFRYSKDFDLTGGRTGRVVDLCRQLNASHLLNGPAAKVHMDENLFREAGIEVSYMDYSGYPEYPQLFPPFEHKVSILDLLFNTGKNAPDFMKSPHGVGPVRTGGR